MSVAIEFLLVNSYYLWSIVLYLFFFGFYSKVHDLISSILHFYTHKMVIYFFS
uniref:Uncharacterized protein n=1 Tax=Octopus bimaculoides TaxID=37653 RepID=A0A0L8GZA8_OCTBM